MLIKEFRVILPITVEEYQVGQLWSVAEASKNETGGGEGIEVLKNEPFENEEFGKGQYTLKIYHLASKVPSFIRLLAPKGSLEIQEEAWNAYPYCKTVISNPEYMKEGFHITIETWHKPDRGTIDNVHNLGPEEVKKREVIFIDIANDPVSSKDYNEKQDPSKFHSQKTGRGPLKGDWRKTCTPCMCAYKLVTVEFKWWGLQSRVEALILKTEQRIFTNFHRQLFCWIDNWHGLTMDDIRAIEEKTKDDLDKQRQTAGVRGTTSTDE
ncbi:phosphatidylinositol transfer protein alpha isoform-like isoform X2 [Saccoglossus kowalevskii]|uniref:Phosphatidylinositol transfer protein alpha isoform-like isoform X2 n=1 Tax=Saccoglossus kowalevskii TaxID=10224 RepID=A0ABM0LWU6_SACKO|nr:PREDICTED: phosphatidylinositol transfer protein alpha isoform-like isoform X2 [Saccoglossus kowalevskii]